MAGKGKDNAAAAVAAEVLPATVDPMAAMLARLEAAEAKAAEAEARAAAAEKAAAEKAAKANGATGSITTKAGEKGGVCVYGLQTRPVHLYASQYLPFMANLPNVIGFILGSKATLSWKDRRDADTVCEALDRIKPQVEALAEAILPELQRIAAEKAARK